MIEKWKIFEQEFIGTADGNPFSEVQLSATFTNGSTSKTVKGFYKEAGRYAIRFMPSKEGIWSYTTKSNRSELNGKSGTFECTPASRNNHGRVILKRELMNGLAPDDLNHEANYKFSYEDGTKYLPFGTTAYMWGIKDEDEKKVTLDTLSHSPFNKIRMYVYPMPIDFELPDSFDFPFSGNPTDGFDFSKFNNRFFEKYEESILALDELGIQADIIILHPYDDTWGTADMTLAQQAYYISYLVRRLSHFKNVWWSMANEYDLFSTISNEDWDYLAKVVMENDPYGHMRSIHNCMTLPDYNKKWITHCSIQRIDIYKVSENITQWRQDYHKPVIIDEAGYEGVMNLGWGNLTAEEMTRRFWEGFIRGGYVCHGENYINLTSILWGAQGGKLYGKSSARIGFLRNIMEDAPENTEPLIKTADFDDCDCTAPCIHADEDYFLYYFGLTRPAYCTFSLPCEKFYKAELIDTWNMTITPYKETYNDNIRLEMPSQQYMAIRLRSI